MLNSKASDRGFPGLNFDITPFVYKVFRRTPPVTGPTDLSGFGEIQLYKVYSVYIHNSVVNMFAISAVFRRLAFSLYLTSSRV